ncbi:MAG: LPS assembly protein LptD [Caulobacteraceae bacterium]|nr:LPS assembly protein LptD [Caulobacteraceae bacterium]
MSDAHAPHASGMGKASGLASPRALLASLAGVLGLSFSHAAEARDWTVRWSPDEAPAGARFAAEGEAGGSAPAEGQPRATASTPGPDGLRADGFYLEADTVGEDREKHTITARGNVQGRYRGRTLRADEITYEQDTGLVTARGHAQIINADGTVQYADEIALDEDLRAGVATGFAARLDNNYKVAAASAVRRSENVNELNRAIFTPCDICTADGKPKTPSFDIVADKVVQDRAARVVYYRSAVVRLFGVPVLYAPVFWHPDPTAEAASGFLMPMVEVDKARGLSWTQPYLWVRSPSEDLTIAPQINTQVNPLLNLEYRRRFWSGELQGRFGYTYEQDFDNHGNKFDDEASRGYALADGRFAINPEWRWGFALEYASDDTFFDRYSVSGVYQQRGLFLNDSRRLLSQVYVTHQTDRMYFSAALLHFQSLRFVTDPLNASVRVAEDDDALPLVAPVVELRWEPGQSFAGGRLRVYGSAVALEREEEFLNPFLPRVEGVDSRRVSGEVDWRRAFTTAGGVRLEPFLTARADAYSLSDVPGVGDDSLSRGNITGGLDVRYPLFRRFGDTTVVIEPMAQVAVSPRSDIDPVIPNEDSLVLEVDETNIFRADRFPGFDLYEGGARATVGGQAKWTWGDNGDREARLFLGRTFRTDEERAFPPETGFRQVSSDWVVAASFTPVPGINAWTRARIDDNGDVRHGEAAIDWTTSRTKGYVRYVVDDRDAFDLTRPRREEVESGGELFVTDNWGVTFRGHYDFEDQKWRRSELGLVYQDECLRLEVVYERNETRVGELRPSESVFFRLNLATLGDTGYRNDDRR